MAKKKPIVSSLGQWAYPGEVTIIPSNQITMQGVNYPVLGIDNLGNQQVMIPGMDYIFPGDYVTEIPAAQFGGMSKRKIDNILNKNQDLNWVQRLYQSNTPRIQIPGEPGLSTHFMETGDGRVYPTVVQMPDGQLQYLGDNAYDYAMLTGEYIQFPNDRQARRFAKNYKKGTDVLEEFGKGGLTQWFAEKWVDVKTGKPCGRSGKDKDGRPYPACRPSKRVNETTPKTASEMSSKEKAKFKREKTSGKRIDYNHKRRQAGGENWLDQYQTAGEIITRDNTFIRPPINIYLPESETEILKEFYPKAKPEINPLIKDILKSADLGTDFLQLGHFIPDPLAIGQIAGFVGDVTGAAVDGAQALINTYEGDYKNAIGNIALAAAPGILKKQGYTRPNSLMTGKGQGVYYPLTATTPALAKNPVIKKGLNYNRGFLGATSAEVNSNLNYNLSGYLNANNSRTYSDNTRLAPQVIRKQLGGENWLDEYQTGGFMYTPPARTSFLKSNTPVGGYSDNTRVNNPNNNVSDQTRTRIEAQRAEEARRKRSGVISAGTTPSTYQKIKDATSFVENEKQRTGSASPLSYVLDVVNPATYAFAATDLVGNTGSAIKNVAQGNFQEAGSDLLNAGMNVLYLLPAVSPAKSAARFATTQTPLKNAYKINPWAFKPNPNAYYRMIGKEGYADALESGVIRPPQKTRIFDQGSQQYIDIPIPAYQEAYYNAQFPLDRRWYPNSIKKIDPKKAETAKKSGYAGPYMAEVTGNSNLFKNGESVAAYTGPNSSQTVTYSKEFIPINTPGVKFYKEDWLQGYKPIQISDMQPSASLSNLNKTDIRYLSRELLGEALSGNKNRQAIAEGNAWLKNWIDDPITQAKIDTDLGWIPERNNILKDQFSLGYEQAKSFTPLSKEYPFSEQFKDLFVRNQPHIHSGNSGVSYLHRRDPYSRSIGEMFSNPKLNSSWISRNLSMSKPMRRSTTIHEGTHDWTSDFLLRESGQLDDIKKLYPDKIKEINKNWQSLRDQGINPSTVMGTENANLGYLADPTEVHARVMELRQLLGMTPEQSVMVTPEKAADIIRIIQKPENAKFIDPKFLDVIESDPKKLASLFNRLWATAPIGIGAAGVVGSQLNKSESKPQMKMGGWLDSYQDGGESLPELNSKIDVANFYKTPLSNKYGIFQNPDTGNLEYYLKSNTEEPVSYTSEKGAPDLSDISGKKLKASQEKLSNIEPTTSIILPREKEVYDEEDSVMNDLSDDIVITPPSEEELLKYLPKIEDSKEPTKVKEPVKVNTQQKQFTFNPTYWDNSDLQTEVFNRQLKDNKWYGSFNKRGDNVLNRTDVKRNYDSEVFLQDVATPNSVIIDIGSALGNNNPKLAGVSVYELTSNPKIKSKNIKVIATDIPSEIKGFEQLKKNSTVYPIDYATVPETFNTPVRDILKNKKIENVKDVYLRAANSIDLLMNVEQTAEHFKHISNTLKDKNVTYLYNNVILYKPAGSTKFEKMGNLNNSAFDHRSATWKNNPNRNHYTLLPTRSFGGENNWLNKYK